MILLKALLKKRWALFQPKNNRSLLIYILSAKRVGGCLKKKQKKTIFFIYIVIQQRRLCEWRKKKMETYAKKGYFTVCSDAGWRVDFVVMIFKECNVG